MNAGSNAMLWAVFAVVGIIWFILGIIGSVQAL